MDQERVTDRDRPAGARGAPLACSSIFASAWQESQTRGPRSNRRPSRCRQFMTSGVQLVLSRVRLNAALAACCIEVFPAQTAPFSVRQPGRGKLNNVRWKPGSRTSAVDCNKSGGGSAGPNSAGAAGGSSGAEQGGRRGAGSDPHQFVCWRDRILKCGAVLVITLLLWTVSAPGFSPGLGGVIGAGSQSQFGSAPGFSPGLGGVIGAGPQSQFYSSPSGIGSACTLRFPCSLITEKRAVETAIANGVTDPIAYLLGNSCPGSVSFTGWISLVSGVPTLTVSTTPSGGSIQGGMILCGAGLSTTTYVASFDTGTGRAGTYVVGPATVATVGFETITGFMPVVYRISSTLSFGAAEFDDQGAYRHVGASRRAIRRDPRRRSGHRLGLVHDRRQRVQIWI